MLKKNIIRIALSPCIPMSSDCSFHFCYSLVIQKEDAELAPEIIEENENTATYASFRKPLSRIGWSEWGR
jgi:hypothetical protein